MPMILVSGFMLDDDLWRDVQPALAAYAPVSHADLSRDDTLPAMAKRVLSAAPESFVLLGFSMGGYVAREVARLAPDRVSALVLVATSARGDTPAETKRKEAAVGAVSKDFAGLSRSTIARSLHPDRERDEALVGRIQAMGRRLGGGTFRRQSLLARRDDRDALAEIRCPTLVIAGERDRLRSLNEAHELRDGIPGAGLVVIEGTGHMIPMEVPNRLAAVVTQWLTVIDSTGSAAIP